MLTSGSQATLTNLTSCSSGSILTTTYWIAYQKIYIKGDVTMEFEGYCVKCRKKQTIKDGKVEQTAQNRRMAKGTCPECGTKVNRFLPSKKDTE